MLIRCDRCGHKAIITKRQNITKTLTKLYCICNNVQCAHSFVMNLEFAHTISPSALDFTDEKRLAITTGASRHEIQQLLL